MRIRIDRTTITSSDIYNLSIRQLQLYLTLKITRTIMQYRFYTLQSAAIVHHLYIRDKYTRTAFMRIRTINGIITFIIIIRLPMLLTRTDRLHHFILIPSGWIAELKYRRLIVDHLLDIVQGDHHTITAPLIVLIILHIAILTHFHIFICT